MELLFRILFGCPRCFQAAGSVLLTFSIGMLLGAWRLAKRVDRVEGATGVSIDLTKALEVLPFPTTAGGYALAIAGVIVGAFMLRLGAWAAKL